MATRSLAAWREVRLHPLVVNVVVVPVHAWQRPPPGWIKINVDASLGGSGGFVGIGAVVRDSHAHFLAARTWGIPDLLDAKSAEAIAIREVLSWIKDKVYCLGGV
ncbi:hypothetical protein JCGZ_24451 [Jatropha curcas]|uniref:RNase H type-1 domain-containing protein n=1 Tax=Jatropha curcas TaxID=180498 RepID=A0A067JLU5_JATCU|nr:hypothetical protein JCGZ_24451 [Jatropha curcas]